MNSARNLLATLLAAACVHGAENHTADDELALAAAQLAAAAGLAQEPIVQAAVEPNESQGAGSWGSVINWTPHIPVSAANLPDGRLLTFASNQRTTFPVGPEFTYAATWNPATGAFQEFNHNSHDMFCGGMVMLPDGRVMVNGGRNEVTSTSVFDWRNNSWTRLQNMNGGRWYNTSVALSNGNVFTATGSGTGINTTERWAAANGWSLLSGIGWPAVTNSDGGYIKHWHPFVSLAPSGRLMHFGPTDTMHWFDVTGSGSFTNSGTTVPGSHYPKEGAWAMYDEGRVLVAGGGQNTTASSGDSSIGISSNSAYTVNMSMDPPQVSSTASMAYQRQFANAVVLPGGEVMVIGGNNPGRKFSDAGSIMPCEIWNPRTSTWRTVASISVPRNYHSVALLLPDGRVWSGGGGLGGGDHRDAQIYTPPALFTSTGAAAVRPTLNSAPARIGPGTTFTVTGSAGIVKFSLIRMAAVTHSVNTDQRYLTLPFIETSPGTYQLTARSNLNVMTPGYWMLFGINQSGAFSVSRTVQVDATAGINITAIGARQGTVNVATSLQVQATGPAGTALAYSAGGLPNGLSINSGTGLISGTPTTSGIFNTRVTVSGGGASAIQDFTWTILLSNTGSGTILREWWTGISGSTLSTLTSSSSYPNSPTGSSQLTSLETPTDWAENHGQRVRGYVHPPITGQYRFWIASDDEGQLLLSSGREPAQATTIARVPGWSASREWTKFPEQTSALITLQAGQSYYIEALMKEGGGGDNLAVAWATPGTSTPVVIAGQYLSPWVNNRVPIITNPGPLTHVVSAPLSGQITATDPDGDTIRFAAVGLPSGLSIDQNSGWVTGTPTATGIFNVNLTATDSRGGIGSASFTWTIVPVLNLNTPPAATAIAVNTTANYTITSTGGVNVRYRWSWGDGTADSAYSPTPGITHVFSAPGRYQITVTATDDTGRIVTATFYQIVHATLTALKPAASASMVYEDRPTGTNDRIWCVNGDNNSVSVFDAVTRARLAEIVVGTAPRALAVGLDGRVWVSNVESGSISIISGSTLAVTQTLTLPRGSRPFGIAFDPDGTDAWVVCEGTGRLLRFNPTTAAQVASMDVGLHARHISISADSARLFVTRFITPPLPGEATATVTPSSTTGGEVLSILSASLTLERRVILQHSDRLDTITTGRGIPNYLGPAVISPDNLSAWVPSKQDNIKRGILRDGNELTHDQTIRSIASRIPLTSGSPAAVDDVNARVDFDNAGIAVHAAFDRTGSYLFTALEGSREIGVVDVWGRREIRRFSAGRAPQAVAVSPDGRTVYAHNFMDRNITVHDVGGVIDGRDTTPSLVATLNCITTERLSAAVLLGKKHFYDATDSRIAFQQYISCASCHNDGGQDGRIWDFTGFGEGLRNTITLKGRGGMAHGPVHWSGNFDEIQDFENQLRSLPGGTGLISGTAHPPLGTPNAGRSADLDALALYVSSLTTTDASPFKNATGTLTSDASAGRTVFQNFNCAQCHSGSAFTDSALNRFQNVGTLKTASGKRLGGTLTGLDTPTLRGLWDTAPYLHDGSASTLTAAINAHNTPKPTGTELTQLVAYLQSIDDGETSAPSLSAPLVTLSAPSSTTGAFSVSITVSQAVTGLAATDFTVTNGSATSLTGTGSSYTLTVTPSAPGNVTVLLPAGSATNIAGAGNTASNQTTTSYSQPDTTPPSVVLSTASATVSTSFSVAVTTSETVTGLALADFTVTNGSASALSGSGSAYTVTITPLAAGTVTVRLPAGAAADAAGNPSLASNTLSVTYTPADTTPPSVTLTATSMPSSTGVFTVDATFSETVTGFIASDFIVTNGSVTGLSSVGNVHTATIQATATGDVTVRLPAGAAADAAGNASLASSTISVRFEAPAAFNARINFQPSGSAIPNGYIADSGALFGTRNALQYGWTTAHTSHTRDRNYHRDQLLDTFIQMQAGAAWEIAVPNGQYDVAFSVGDPLASTRATIRVEGITVLNNVSLSFGRFRQATARVTVTDGRLRIDNGSASNNQTRINYATISAVTTSPLPTTTTGIKADYFAGRNFEQLRVSRTDQVIDFDWGTGTPDSRVPTDGFSVRWTGHILPRYTGTYTFITTSDDGVRLSINGVRIINQWNDHSPTQHSGTISLQAGVPVTLLMEHYENGGGAVARLEWQSSQQAREIIPAERFVIPPTGTTSGTMLLTGTVEANPYPTTYSVWRASGRLTDLQDDNADGDDHDDLMEYGLGGTPGTGIQISEGFHLSRDESGSITASIICPTAPTDLRYSLETTQDMRYWSEMALEPTLQPLEDGTVLLEWTALETRTGLTPETGIVRLRIAHSSGISSVSSPYGWQSSQLAPGTHAFGLNIVHPPLFAGFVSANTATTIELADLAAHGRSPDPDARYYIEIRNGSLEGHRFDLATIEEGVLTIDTTSAVNTLPQLIESALAGARVVVRPHVTLEQLMPKENFTGSTRATTSDQVLFHHGNRYETLFLLKTGTNSGYHQWTSANDASLDDAGKRIIPPGTGLMLRLVSSPKTIAFTGSVRMDPFARKLSPGHNLIANPWPLDTSPTAVNLTLQNGFTGTLRPTTSDQIQLWNGVGYTSYWLINGGTTWRHWTAMDSASLEDYGSLKLLRSRSATFLKVQEPSTRTPWIVNVP